MPHEPDIQKAFQEFFNEWVAEETAERANLAQPPAPEPPQPHPKELRRAIRDEALDSILHTINKVREDRLEMVRFENP